MAVNTTYVITVLASVDDYLSWKIQFTSFDIMHQLPGILDGTVIQPPSTILVAPDVGQHNSTWVDQPIWAWIFATISKETLCEVHNISHALPI